jgi:hypothetical protein
MSERDPNGLSTQRSRGTPQWTSTRVPIVHESRMSTEDGLNVLLRGWFRE